MKLSYLFSHLLVLFLVSYLVACANFDRSGASGYADRRQTQLTRTSSRGSSNGRLEEDEESINEKTRLKQLENALSSRKETEQYSKALPCFENDRERIEFLQLPGFETRQKWLVQQGFSSRAAQTQTKMKDLIESQDIALGMSQSLVKQAWGDPDQVEVSGNPQFKNERWHYNKFVSTQDGFKPEKKLVFFEGGKVVGWELE